jgi:chemotaxis protein CheD
MICYGLGSCVALFLYDTQSMNCAGAHIMLPGAFQQEHLGPGCYADNAIETLVNAMVLRGSELKHIRASMVGGANVANISTIPVGKLNVANITHELEARGIVISASEVGGDLSRTVRFHSDSKQLSVRSIKIKSHHQHQILITKNYA